jgi:hypothetical protein
MIVLCRSALNYPQSIQHIDYLIITQAPPEYIEDNPRDFFGLFYLKTPDLL